MSNIKYFLGIDGGGTKTEFVLSDKSGIILNRFITDSSNPNDIGIDECLRLLQVGCKKTCGMFDFKNISVVAGIAGASTGNYSDLIRDFLYSSGFANAECFSDTKLTVSATLGSKDGICVIIGTGIVIIIQKNGILSTVGGYNYFFDKGGSAFNIGRDAIMYSLLCEERNYPETPLCTSVRNKCATETVKENLSQFYKGGKKYIAQFAQCVTCTFESDDESKKIIETNMMTVAEQINHALLVCDTDTIYFAGGLASERIILKKYLSEFINKPCELIFNKGSIVDGALKLAGVENTYVENRRT